jgi:class 3 adenylate cyclase
VVVERTPESDAFFEKLQKKFAGLGAEFDPEYHLVPVLRAFIRLDVAKFSQFAVSLQPIVLADIQETAQAVLRDPWAQIPMPEEVIHIGDGFILSFQWHPEIDNQWLVKAAAMIAEKLDLKNDNESRLQVHFRMSVTLGPTFLTRDLKGRLNYVGEAITETERLLSCMPANLDDLVYISDPVYRALRPHVSDRINRLGSGVDKHGIHHRLYSLEYVDFNK